MARRDQPYIPLYVQDFLTDEKLIECSAQATGVYIRLMCLMHKNEVYGTILLKQKHKQNEKQTKNFATQLVKQMPYDLLIIEQSIDELLEEKVIEIIGDSIIQNRMIKDNQLSETRANSGSKGGSKTQKTNKNLAKAKTQANTEYENEYESVIENENNSFEKEGTGEKTLPADEIRDSEIFQKTSEFFSQTTEVLQMRMFGDFKRIENNGKLEQFEKQTIAYIEYKQKTKEVVHRWQNYLSEWETENWIDKLKKEKSKGETEKKAFEKNKSETIKSIEL